MTVRFPPDRSERDDEAWAWLERHYPEHRRRLYRFAYGLLGNREDAEDALQIVLLNAHRALVRGERPRRPRAWLFTIALNVCRRLLQQASARRRRAAVTGELSPLRLQRGVDVLTGAEISDAVASLPPGQREIFLLRELQGLSYAELSERLDVSPAAAASLLARARRRLREQLAAHGESPEPSRSRARRPLLGIPGAGASFQFARVPAALKVAGLAGAAAMAPAVVVGLPARPEHSLRPAVQVRAAIVASEGSSPRRTRTRSAERASTPQVVQAAKPTPIAPVPRAVAIQTASAEDASRKAGQAPEQPSVARAASVADEQSAAPAVEPTAPRPTADQQPNAEALGTVAPAPVPETGISEVVDDALTTAQGVVEEVAPATPSLPVPAPPVPDSLPADPLSTLPPVSTPALPPLPPVPGVGG